MHDNLVAMALWEPPRLFVNTARVLVTLAEEADGRVRGITFVESTSVGVTGDHGEAPGELVFLGFGATMCVVDTHLGSYVLERAVVLVPVIETWKPVVGLVVLDEDSRAFALAEPLVIVCRSKSAGADYIVFMLVIARSCQRWRIEIIT